MPLPVFSEAAHSLTMQPCTHETPAANEALALAPRLLAATQPLTAQLLPTEMPMLPFCVALQSSTRERSPVSMPFLPFCEAAQRAITRSIVPPMPLSLL